MTVPRCIPHPAELFLGGKGIGDRAVGVTIGRILRLTPNLMTSRTRPQAWIGSFRDSVRTSRQIIIDLLSLYTETDTVPLRAISGATSERAISKTTIWIIGNAGRVHMTRSWGSFETFYPYALVLGSKG